MSMIEHNFYCLFNTGEFARVIVEKHENDPSEPVQGFFILEGGAGFSLAAKRAAVKVYSVLKNQGMSIPKFSAMFDLSMASTQDLMNLSGQSGGLVFALALASEITKKGYASVAATGIIAADGSIGKVKQADFSAKVEAACRALPEGGVMLYPRDNRIPDENIEILKGKGIDVIPVETVAQALLMAGISGAHDAPEPTKRSCFTALFVLLLLLLALIVGVFFLNHSPGTVVGSGGFVFDSKVHGENQAPFPKIHPFSVSALEKKTKLDKGFK